MAITILWDKNDPANSEDPRNGAAEIRQLKQGLSERLNQGAGIFLEDPSGTSADAGKLCAGLQAANKWRVYETNKTTVMLEFDDNTSQCLIGDGKNGANPYELIARRMSASVTSFDKGAIQEFSSAAGTVAAGATTTWPGAPQALTVSLEASPRVLVSAYFTCSNAAANDEYLDNVAVQVERNASGAWFNIIGFALGALPLRFTMYSDGAETEGFFSGSALLSTTFPGGSPIAASDSLKFRWTWTADGGNAATVNLDTACIVAHELVH